MSKIAGIYIKIGDDSLGDYRTMYLGEDGHSIEVSWPDVEAFLQGCIEGLTTYHEERQQTLLPGMTEKDAEDMEAQGWRFTPANDERGIKRVFEDPDLPF